MQFTERLRYGAFGRRVEFENVGAGTTVRYYHDGVSVIQERDTADELVRSHVNGAQYLDEHVTTFEATGLRAGETSYYLLGGNHSVVGVGRWGASRPRSSAASGESRVHERILMRDVTTGTEYYYLPQDMHSVSALADASGHVVESYRYDVYGKVTMTGSHGHPIEQSEVGNPYFFTGRWLDFYTDPNGQLKQFYDYRARTYDPENGRFLQRDPTGYVDGGNLYEAFGSNPARFRDALGMQSYPWEYTSDNPYREQFLRDPCSAAGRGPAEAFRKGHEALAAMREADFWDMLESWKTPGLIGESPPWGEHKIAAVTRILSAKHLEAMHADLSLLTPLNAPDVYLNSKAATSDELCFEIWLDFSVYATRTTSDVTGAAALGLQGGQFIVSRWVAARGLRSSGAAFGGAARLSGATYSLWDDVPRAARLWEVPEGAMQMERAGALKAAVTAEKEQLLRTFVTETPTSTAAGRCNALDRLATARRIESAAAVRGATAETRTLLAPAKRMTGETVLGRYPQYVELSEQLGARRYDVPMQFWNKMTPAEQWAANQRFLDRTILRGDKILLSTNPLVRENLRGSFAKETQYMMEKGYTISPDGKLLISPGVR